jgi:hypothetical protein
MMRAVSRQTVEIVMLTAIDTKRGATPRAEFEEWLAFTFDRALRGREEIRMDQDRNWDVDWEGDWMADCHQRYPLYFYEHLPVEDKAGLYVRLFSDPGRAMQAFDDDQVAFGINNLLNGSYTNDLYHIFDAARLQDHQIAILDGLKPLYSEVFLPRCGDTLGHLNEPGSALASVCYMFWDVCAVDSVAKRAGLLPQAISVMQHGLSLYSAPCQESALHGLGHGVSLHGRAPQEILARYLERPSHTLPRPELRAYAERALQGCIL